MSWAFCKSKEPFLSVSFFFIWQTSRLQK